MQKTITGRVAADDTTPFNYTSPMDNMIKITNNIFDDAKVIYGENIGLTANEGRIEGQENPGTVIGPLYSLTESAQFAGFTRLGLSANFRSWLTGQDVESGTYGLMVRIYTTITDQPGSKNKNALYDLRFDSSKMIGNPYQFESYFYQEEVFDISYINNINKIEVYFYQSSNFFNVLGGPIDWKYNDELLGETVMPANLFVDDVKIYFGYEKGKFTDDTLMLFSNDPLSYHYTNLTAGNLEEPKMTDYETMDEYYDAVDEYHQALAEHNSDADKTVSLRWIHKIADNEFELLDGKNLDSKKFEIKWFQQSPGCETVDQYGGRDWRLIPEDERDNDGDQFTCIFHPDSKQQTMEVKAIGLVKDQIIHTDTAKLNNNDAYKTDLKTLNEEWTKVENYENNADYQSALKDLQTKYLTEETIKPYYSNILIFENEEDVPNVITYDASNALSIVCMDNSEGNYFLYDQNGSIIDEGQGQGFRRTVEARYKGAKITNKIGTIDYLKWYFPKEVHQGKDSYTMIINELIETEIEEWNGIDYVISRRGPKNIDEASGELSTTEYYSIKNYYNMSDANNTIRCVLSINGVEYVATKELLFGKAGTNGSNATFVLSFLDNKDALVAADGESITAQVELYDMNNSRVGFTEGQANKIQWSWFKESDVPYMQIIRNTDNATVTIKYIIPTAEDGKDPPVRDLKDNYHILKATFNNGNTYNLEAYLPIPLKKEAKYTQFEGAKQVIYNHQGVPNYYPKEYVLHKYENGIHTEVKGVEWELNTPDKNIEVNPGDDPQIEEKDIPNAKEMTKSLLPTLKVSDVRSAASTDPDQEYKALSVSSFYVSGFNDKVCVYCMDATTKEVLWSQPILIMQSQYDFAMLNSWDGSLTIDEENGTILSTMLGAGRKNADDNTFSGVLIGDIRDGTDLNSASNMTGVYGYHHGVQSYSLTEDGKATFGKAGRGQIQLDGNTSTIQSASFNVEGSGMKIDLDDGIIDIRNRGHRKIYLSPNLYENDSDAYLTVNGKFGTKGDIPLLKVSEGNYFLQSHSHGLSMENTEDGNPFEVSGTYLDLNDGTFFTKGASGSVMISGATGESKDLLKITHKNLTPLIEMDDTNYYLQSSDYAGRTIKQITDDSNGRIYTVYKVPSNMQTIPNGTNPEYEIGQYVAINGNTVKKVNGDTLGDIINFSATSITITYTDPATNEVVTSTNSFTATEWKNRFINSLETETTSSDQSGLKIDLNNGHITGFNLFLQGIQKTTNKKITLDTSHQTTPFRIGDNFYVTWDGELTCNKLTQLTNNGNTGGNIVQISDNFYINQSGGAGGSGCNFGGSFSGGFSGVGSGTFKGVGDFDTLKVGGYEYKDQLIQYIKDYSLERSGKNIQYKATIGNMYVLCRQVASDGSFFSTGVSIDHTHYIPSHQELTGSTKSHQHYYYYRENTTNGIQ